MKRRAAAMATRGHEVILVVDPSNLQMRLPGMEYPPGSASVDAMIAGFYKDTGIDLSQVTMTMQEFTKSGMNEILVVRHYPRFREDIADAKPARWYDMKDLRNYAINPADKKALQDWVNGFTDYVI